MTRRGTPRLVSCVTRCEVRDAYRARDARKRLLIPGRPSKSELGVFGARHPGRDPLRRIPKIFRKIFPRKNPHTTKSNI